MNTGEIILYILLSDNTQISSKSIARPLIFSGRAMLLGFSSLLSPTMMVDEVSQMWLEGYFPGFFPDD